MDKANVFEILIVNHAIEHPTELQPDSVSSACVERRLAWVLGLSCLLLLFVNLGGAALFEPDEGRNAEKAREILLLNDWVTPHENFLPVMDKPMFFYWLIAIAYKLFGVSEWSARLPSALAALGCLCLVYRFAAEHWGKRQARWSVLILVTSVEFFLLARIVIFDMTLTFLTTLALFSFYSALHAPAGQARRIHCLLMYLALGAGTLFKGLVGFVVPGMIFFFYLLCTKRWRSLRELNLLQGAVIFFAVVAPWYLWAEARNPGYLRYYFWDEHFTRYLTDEFKRTKSWYYLSLVLAVGFLPWSAALPVAAKKLWKNLDDRTLFLLLWILLPLAFFSASNSQLPHYILPIFPALAILVGHTIVESLEEAGAKISGTVYYSWAISAGFVLYLSIGLLWPQLLAREIRSAVVENGLFVTLSTLALLILYGVYALCADRYRHFKQRAIFPCSIVGMTVFFLLVGQIKENAADQRTAKTLADAAAPFISPDSQIVLFNTYVTGLPFYLRIDRPIWIVNPKGKSTLMGSPYVSRMLPAPAPGHGKVLFNIEEFAASWAQNERPFRVFLKARNVSQLNDQVATATSELVRVDEHVLVTKR